MAVMKAVELTGIGFEYVKIGQMPKPEPKAGEVLVRMRAASLNYRDLLMVQGVYSRRKVIPIVPLSDGAGAVEAVGEGVTQFQPGDRVIGSFFQDWIAGPPRDEKFSGSLAADLPGVLSEYRCFPEHGLVRTPDYLSDEAAATLPCAALTAWSALVAQSRTAPGDTVLIQGTGGVALFALQFAKICGAQVIVTSSSDEKLERAGALGADHVLNYRKIPEWGKAAVALNGGRGVDHIIELGGAATLAQSLRTVRAGGTISMIGVLSGPTQELLIPLIVTRNLRLQGITVGSREWLADMAQAMALHRVMPVIGRIFEMAEIRDAYNHMAAGGHFGKIVIRI